MTGKQMQQIILQHTCPLDEIIEDWVRDKESIAESELIKTKDLFYCLHTAVRSAQLGKPTVPSTFDPIGPTAKHGTSPVHLIASGHGASLNNTTPIGSLPLPLHGVQHAERRHELSENEWPGRPQEMEGGHDPHAFRLLALPTTDSTQQTLSS